MRKNKEKPRNESRREDRRQRKKGTSSSGLLLLYERRRGWRDKEQEGGIAGKDGKKMKREREIRKGAGISRSKRALRPFLVQRRHEERTHSATTDLQPAAEASCYSLKARTRANRTAFGQRRLQTKLRTLFVVARVLMGE